jgi:small subunit ribosomal protein S6
MAVKSIYELTVILNGALEEDAIQQVVDRTTEYITRNGGEISNTDHWGRKRLAYPINKKHTGYYVQYAMTAPPELAALLERYFHLEEHVIRFLNLRLEEKDLQDREEMKVRMAAEAEAEAAGEGERREGDDRGDRDRDRGDRDRGDRDRGDRDRDR